MARVCANAARVCAISAIQTRRLFCQAVRAVAERSRSVLTLPGRLEHLGGRASREAYAYLVEKGVEMSRLIDEANATRAKDA